MINHEGIGAAQVTREPFEFFTVSNVLNDSDLDAIRDDFPSIQKPGIYPLSALEYGPAFSRLIDEIRSDRLARYVGAGVTLSAYSQPSGTIL